MNDWVALLTISSALGSGLMAGVFFAFSTFVMRALARRPFAEGIGAMQELNHPRLEVEGFCGGRDDWKSAKAQSPTVKSGSGGSRSCPSM